jgi:L-amino acid N-acyltransferase YncA
MDDLGPITEIFNQAVTDGQKVAFLETFTTVQRLEWFKEHFDTKFPVIVAEIDHTVVGYATLSPYRKGRSALRYTAEVGYFVHYDFHHRGVGSALLSHIIELCSKIEIKTLIAILIDTNSASKNLLAKFGFKQWGHLPEVAVFGDETVGHYYYGLHIGK